MLSRWIKLKLIWLSEGPLMAQSWKMPRGTRGVIALKENPETVNSGKFKIEWGVSKHMQNDSAKGKQL